MVGLILKGLYVWMIIVEIATDGAKLAGRLLWERLDAACGVELHL